MILMGGKKKSRTGAREGGNEKSGAKEEKPGEPRDTFRIPFVNGRGDLGKTSRGRTPGNAKKEVSLRRGETKRKDIR